MDTSATPPLPPEIWDRVPVEAQASILLMQAEIVELKLRVQMLEARLGQNSSNSSQPPSSDPPRAPRRGRSDPSGRPAGGQKGHDRHLRMLRPVEEADQVVEHWPARCDHCQQPLPEDPSRAVGEPIRHQVTDLPPLRAPVTEHLLHRVSCATVGVRRGRSCRQRYPPGYSERSCRL